MFKRIRFWWLKKKVTFALNLLGNLEPLMKSAGISRQQRRFLWRSMPNESDRKKVINSIAKQLNMGYKLPEPEIENDSDTH